MHMNSSPIHNSFLDEQLVMLFEGFPHHDIRVEATLDSDCIFVVTAIGQPHMLHGGFYAMFEKGMIEISTCVTKLLSQATYFSTRLQELK